MMYREIGKTEYLEQARKAASYIKNHPTCRTIKYLIGILTHDIPAAPDASPLLLWHRDY